MSIRPVCILPLLTALLTGCPKPSGFRLPADLQPDDCSKILVRDDGRLVACYRSVRRTQGAAEIRLYRHGKDPEVIRLENGPGHGLATYWSFVGKQELLGSTYELGPSWLINTGTGKARLLPSVLPVDATNGQLTTLLEGRLAKWDGGRFVPHGASAPCSRILAWSPDDGDAMIVCADTTVWILGNPNVQGPKLDAVRPYRLVDLAGPGKVFIYEPMTPGWVIEGASIRPASTTDRTEAAPHLPAWRRNPTPTSKKDRTIPVFIAHDGRISFPVPGEVARSPSGSWVLRQSEENGWTLNAIPPALVRSLQPHVEWDNPSLLSPGFRFSIDREIEKCLTGLQDLASLEGARIETVPVEHHPYGKPEVTWFRPSIRMDGVPETVGTCLATLVYEPGDLRTGGRLVFE